jgi:hypothetical protein
MTDEQFKELLEFLENLDANRMLSELAVGRKELTKHLANMAFNPNGGDQNGCQTKYAIMEKEIIRIDELILTALNTPFFKK